VEYGEDRIRCYLDGKLIQEATPPNPRPLHVAASKDEKTGEIILKIVNASRDPISAGLDLGTRGSLSGTNTILTAGSPFAENSLDNPKRVAPQTSRIEFKSSRFEQVFPAYSLSVMRLRSRG
jgi:alpha-L-arabinofuranosidase